MLNAGLGRRLTSTAAIGLSLIGLIVLKLRGSGLVEPLIMCVLLIVLGLVSTAYRTRVLRGLTLFPGACWSVDYFPDRFMIHDPLAAELVPPPAQAFFVAG